MANHKENELHYPYGDTLPPTGRTLEVAPGVRWVRMALPFALDHINLWLLRDRVDGREGWTIVDCGLANDTTRDAWEQVFTNELQGLPVLRVIVTHMHPDHIGLAHWLTERWSIDGRVCRLWISATDYNAARVACTATVGSRGADAAAFAAAHGLTDPATLERMRGRSNYYASMVSQVPSSYARLMDDMRLAIGGREWRCIAGYGHAPEHIALYCEALKVMIGGDMMLPRVSTNISVMELEPEGNPLALFLNSIRQLKKLPADTLVLPSHGKPFRGLHERIAQLVEHHDERLAEVVQACAQAPQTATDILPVLFHRQLDLHQAPFAMGEAIAHLNALWFDGRLTRQVAGDGTIRFSAA